MNQFVLVIDRSLVIRKIVEFTLRREGYPAIAFPDGAAAFAWFASPQGRIPALIFIDPALPRMDGYAVVQRLKASKRLRQAPIVILSNREGVVDRLKGRLAGASDYIVKPFTTDQIAAIAHAYLDAPPESDRNSLL